MGRYILGRIAGLLFTFFMVSVMTFSLMHAVPGGPFDENKQPLPPAAKANILRKYGLDRPIYEQYARYMWAALHFDFGIPFQSPTETVTKLIARVWPATLQLAGLVILLSYSLGMLFGILAAINQNTWIDRGVTTLATLGFTVPNFVIGIWLILIVSVRLHWLPTGGWGSPKQFIMPALVYAQAPMALVARYTRVNMLEAMRADYVRTARAKGMSERTIILRHVLKNALIPLITVIGPQIPNIATGSIFIEAVFRIPGLGRYFISSTYNRDYPMIMATMLLAAALWGVTYLISDILYTVIDPRVRLTGRRDA
ncbi:MAG TPA: ABC transporter permease [Spirochaetia bacterium]|nr:ABC transporter permease [Spirochaetia bacterium]